MAQAAAAASTPPTGQASVAGRPSPPILPAVAGLNASTAFTAGSKTMRNSTKPATTMASVAAMRSPPLGRRFQAKMASAMEAAPRNSPSRMPLPPAAQPSATGRAETSTTASPPSAVKPMIPVLNRPA